MPLINDPIGDLLTRIRNSQAANRAQCRAPWSKIRQQICELLVRGKWLQSVEVEGADPKKQLLITFAPDQMSLTLTRISKPGRRIYRSVDELRPVLNGFGIAILTTSEGILTDTEARKKKIGGELLCTIS